MPVSSVTASALPATYFPDHQHSDRNQYWCLQILTITRMIQSKTIALARFGLSSAASLPSSLREPGPKLPDWNGQPNYRIHQSFIVLWVSSYTSFNVIKQATAVPVTPSSSPVVALYHFHLTTVVDTEPTNKLNKNKRQKPYKACLSWIVKEKGLTIRKRSALVELAGFVHSSANYQQWTRLVTCAVIVPIDNSMWVWVLMEDVTEWRSPHCYMLWNDYCRDVAYAMTSCTVIICVRSCVEYCVDSAQSKTHSDIYMGARDGVLVKAPCYKQESRGFETQWDEWIFSIYVILPAALGPGA
jgi:hypothetical protein